MENDWKKRLGVVYSTNPEFEYESEQQEGPETLPPDQQKLYISLDKKNRKGKRVTLIEGFVGSEEELNDLARTLKRKCGVGGSAGDGMILIQGDFREKIAGLLENEGFKVKRSGG